MVEGEHKSGRLAWRSILLLVFAAILLFALGALLGQPWLAILALGPLAAATFLLFLPLVKSPAMRPARRRYRDMNSVGGALTVLGFKPTEQDAARKQNERAHGGHPTGEQGGPDAHL